MWNKFNKYGDPNDCVSARNVKHQREFRAACCCPLTIDIQLCFLNESKPPLTTTIRTLLSFFVHSLISRLSPFGLFFFACRLRLGGNVSIMSRPFLIGWPLSPDESVLSGAFRWAFCTTSWNSFERSTFNWIILWFYQRFNFNKYLDIFLKDFLKIS